MREKVYFVHFPEWYSRPYLVIGPFMFFDSLFHTIWTTTSFGRYITMARIRYEQQKECLFILFPIILFIEWCCRKIIQIAHNEKDIILTSFDYESLYHGHDTTYCTLRKHFAWIHYIR